MDAAQAAWTNFDGLDQAMANLIMKTEFMGDGESRVMRWWRSFTKPSKMHDMWKRSRRMSQRLGRRQRSRSESAKATKDTEKAVARLYVARAPARERVGETVRGGRKHTGGGAEETRACLKCKKNDHSVWKCPYIKEGEAKELWSAALVEWKVAAKEGKKKKQPANGRVVGDGQE